MTTTARTLFALLAAAPLARAQDPVAVFTGPAGAVGSITVHDAVTGAQLAAPPELAGLRLLALDFTGRTQLEEFLATRARYIPEPGGTSRLKLPQDRGSLYHFERPLASGASQFGYLLVDPATGPRVLFELPGTGAAGTTDPFHPRIGVAPDGRAFLAGTTVDAGGDLYEVSVLPVANPVLSRSANLTPLPLLPESFLLGATYGLAVTTRGVVRFDRSTTLDGRKVPFLLGERPLLYTGEIVQSANTDFACFTAGDALDQLHVFTVGASGPARRATPTPGTISGAGSAPQALDGPWLAVSDDGQMAAWRSEVTDLAGATKHDCNVNRVAAPAIPAPEVLSSDARFLDTLDEVALFAFQGPTKLRFAVGERGAPGTPIENLDLFSATVQPGQQPVIANLTLSSGDATEPFLSLPTLKPSRTALLPEGNGTILHDDTGSSGAIYLLRDDLPGAQLVLGNVRSLLHLDFAGPHALMLVRRNGNTFELQRFTPVGSNVPVLLQSGGSGLAVNVSAPRRDGWMAYSLQNGGASLNLTNLRNGTSAPSSGVAGPYDTILGWTGQGRALFSVASSGTWTHHAWTTTGSVVVVATSASESRLLPAL